MNLATQTHRFIPTDPATWPPLDSPVLWAYIDYENKEKYMIAFLLHTKCSDGSENLIFEEVGISGYEYESELDSYTPFAWQTIPTFTLPEEITNAD